MKTSILSAFTVSAMMVGSSNAFTVATPSAHVETRLQMAVEEPTFGRRQALQSILTGGAAFVAASAANALDMDSFANSQLESDTKNCDPKRDPKCIPKLSSDEALCKYGQSGKARGEACKRVKAAGGELPSAKSEGKSLGGAYAI